MRMTWFLIFAVAICASVSAQPTTNPSPGAAPSTPAPAPAITNAPTTPAPVRTNAPTAKKAAKKTAKKAALKKSPADELRTVPLVAGPAVVIASNVNVRGKATINGEVLTKLQKGEGVTVIEEVTLKKSQPDEPSAWAKIVFPAKAHVWVHSAFINATNKTVLPRKLNLRGGPGENYSVVGLLKRGDAVKDVSIKGDWMEIEAPADAYAFVAAQYLQQETPTLAATTPPPAVTPEPAPAPTTVPDSQPIAAAPTESPVTPPTTTPTPTPLPTTPAPEDNTPPPPRIVQREGLVFGTLSIQAPTRFALISKENSRTINYLHTTSPDLDLSRYKGLHIIVTGEEGLDERWKNTPVITIQRIQVLE